MRWLLSLIDRQLPHAEIGASNPVFGYELRSTGIQYSPKELKRWSVSTLARFIPIWIGGWVGLFGVFTLVAGLSPDAAFDGANGVTGVIATVFSFAVMLGANLNYILPTLNTIEKYIGSGRWEMLRLTQMGEKDILKSIHAAGQVRAWQTLLTEFAWRLISAVALLLLLLSPIFSDPYRENSLTVDIVNILFLVIVSAGYILEPFWRMRAFVALSLSISAHRHNPIFAALSGIGNVMVMQLFWIMTVGAWVITLLNLIVNLSPDTFSSPIGSAFVRFAAGLSAVGGTYAFYRALQYVSLDSARRRAFRSE